MYEWELDYKDTQVDPVYDLVSPDEEIRFII